MSQHNCVYCDRVSETVVWSDAHCRVIHVADAKFAGLCRVVWNRHVAEFSDLDETARIHLMKVVAGVEIGLRDLLRPDKINLASLGTGVPHLHWHVIPRFADDKHFPGSVWSEAHRPGVARPIDRDALRRILRNELQAVAQ